MKQALLFLVFMMASFFSFSQSSEMEIEEMELQQLDEVILTAYSSKRTSCGTMCTSVIVIDYS